METCDVLKPTRHGNETLESIQSTDKGDSGIDNIAYLSGGTGHTQVYESRKNMLVSHAISGNQIQSDRYLKDDILSEDEICSDTDDGDYFLADESLEEILDPIKVVPVLLYHFRTNIV